MSHVFTPEDYMPFGKNKGYQLKEIYQFEPNYLEYLIINSDEFAIDIGLFEKLPNPTPFAVGAVTGSQKRKDVTKAQSLSLFDKIGLIDNVNMHFTVKDIKDMKINGLHIEFKLEDGKFIEIGRQTGMTFDEVDFKFSEEAIEKNGLKGGK